MIVVRAEIVDWLVRGDESLVLTQDRCLRLSGVSTAVVAYLDQQRTEKEVEEHLETMFGPAPEGRVSEVLGELAAQRLIRYHMDVVPSADP